MCFSFTISITRYELVAPPPPPHHHHPPALEDFVQCSVSLCCGPREEHKKVVVGGARDANDGVSEHFAANHRQIMAP